MIQHTVVFTLKHARGSREEAEFLEAIQALKEIPTVRHFKRLRQVSPKNSYAFGLSMEFATREDYQTYNDHPIHTAFVASKWVPEVAEFLEIDYSPYDGP